MLLVKCTKVVSILRRIETEERMRNVDHTENSRSGRDMAQTKCTHHVGHTQILTFFDPATYTLITNRV